MQTITIELLNSKALNLLKDLEQLNIIRIPEIKVEDTNLPVPEWHKEIVRKRRKSTKHENIKEWRVLEKSLDKKYGVK